MAKILGTVDASTTPLVQLKIRPPGGVEIEGDALVDTGFNGELIIARDVVQSLGLIAKSQVRATMPDGRIELLDVYVIELRWTTGWIRVDVPSLETESLLGMGLLAGCELKIACVAGGEIQIAPLP